MRFSNRQHVTKKKAYISVTKKTQRQNNKTGPSLKVQSNGGVFFCCWLATESTEKMTQFVTVVG